MATPNVKKAQEAGIAADPKTQGNVDASADHDRVVMASRAPDGTPAQSEGFEYIGDEETVREAARVQLSEQAVSAADVAIRGVATGDTGTSEPDPAVAEIVKAHESAASSAEKKADAEVKKLHGGIGA